ncbi:MAG TPA: GNAT family N-acetyltransferase [Gemmatimonadaceae bacterium]|nr:GNAT family N-acetyltransferase [Gemmatimonadaceae bacterium]
MPASSEWHRGAFRINTDIDERAIDTIHAFLTTSYWAEGIPRDIVARAVGGSLSFGLFHGDDLVGFARVVTDRATYGYLADVFVLEPYRGQKLSRWLLEVIFAHPDLQGFRRWSLSTRDAHELYAKFGFTSSAPGYNMDRRDPDIYKRSLSRN